MRRLRSANHIATDRGSTRTTATGQRNDPVRSRSTQPPVQVYDRVSGPEPVRLSADVGVEQDGHESSVGGFSRTRARHVRREAELPD